MLQYNDGKYTLSVNGKDLELPADLVTPSMQGYQDTPAPASSGYYNDAHMPTGYPDQRLALNGGTTAAATSPMSPDNPLGFAAPQPQQPDMLADFSQPNPAAPVAPKGPQRIDPSLLAPVGPAPAQEAQGQPAPYTPEQAATMARITANAMRGQAYGPSMGKTEVTRFEGTAVKPGQEREFAKAAEEGAEANHNLERGEEQLLEDQQAEALERARLAGEHADLIGAQAQQMQQQVAARQAEMAARLADIEEAETGRREIARQRPTQAMWGTRSAGQKVAASIGLALGELGSNFGGGTNPALDQMNQAIRSETERQKLMFDAASGKVDTANNAFAQSMAIYHDQDAAMQATQALYREKMADELERAAQNSKSEQLITKAQMIADQWRADAAAQRQRAASGVVQTQYQYKPGGVSGGGPAAAKKTLMAMGMDEKTANQALLHGYMTGNLEQGIANAANRAAGANGMPGSEVELSAARDIRGRTVTLPSGQKAYATSPEVANAIQPKIVALNQVMANVARMREIAQKFGSSSSAVKPALHREYEMLAHANASTLGQYKGLGALSESDLEIVSGQAGQGLNDLTTRQADESFTAIENSLRSDQRGMESQLYRDAQLNEPVARPIKVKPVK